MTTTGKIERSATEVDIVFSSEQDELRAVVRRFLAKHATEAAVRRCMATDDGYDTAVWGQLSGEMGLAGLAIPEAYGGAGYGFVELAIVLEEMGRALLCAPFFSTAVLAANVLLLGDDAAARENLLPGIAAGTTIATVAIAEDTGRWDEAGVAATAKLTADGWELSGHKAFVTDGALADVVLVAARSAAGVGIFAVDKGSRGFLAVPVTGIDETRKLARLEFDATPARLLGKDGEGWPVLSGMLDRAAIALAAEQAGGAQMVLDMAVEYAKIRIQFGRPIGSFQAIKHKAADMLLDVESAKSAAYYGAWTVAEGGDDVATVASLAKAYCSEAYSRCAAENIQIHGGIGFTWEHPAHLYFRRAHSTQALLGGPDYHRELLAQRVGV